MVYGEGDRLREPYSKHVQDGLFELRVKFSSDIARVFYFLLRSKIVVTSGFVKKTQKTPPQEIEKALACKQEYEGRQIR